jgi:hypothetical protein
LGTTVFLLASADGVVRCVLTLAGTAIQGREGRLRGGRYTGAVERLLIFGLAMTGHPTAAALVVSAKSILRFPELSRSAHSEERTRADEGRLSADVDVVTECFWLGSLGSRGLALAPVLLLI